MALPRKVLLKKANKFELKELEKNPIPHAHLPDLDKLLNDVCLTQRPTPLGYYNRRDLIRIFNAIAKEIYVNEDVCPVVVGFGSFVMDLFNEGSDLDLSINFGNPAVELPREKKIQTLRTFAKKFYSLQRKGHVTSVQAIMSARVPIVKVIDHGTRIECDLSVENWDGILKSQLVHVISAIDERFQKLSFLMKAWAKANGINSSRDRTLNSLSIILLVAFHFQMRDPPILPPFSLLFKDGLEPENVKKNVDSFLNYGKANKESLALLFVTLLIKLASVEKLWQKGICASVYDGSWISKTWDSRCGTISVEDFTERNENVSRAVGTEEVKKIYDCIHRSIHGLTAFLEGKMPAPMLKELLFGSENVATVQNIDKKESVLSKSPTVNHHHQNKRMQLSANSGESHVTDSQFGSENVATIQNNDKKEDLLSKSPTDDHPHQNEKMQLSANSGESHAADRQTGMENVTSVQKDKKGRVLSKSPTVNHRHKNKKMRLSANSGVGWERTYPGNWGRNAQVNGWGWNGPAYGQTSQHVVPHLRQQLPDQRRVASTWDVKIAPSAWDRQSGLSNFHSVSSTWNGKTGPWNYNYVSSTWDDRIAPANFGSVSSTWGSKVTPPNSGSMASTWGSKIAAPNPSSAAPTWHSNRASLNIPPVASAWDSGIACPNYNPVATLVQAAVAGVHGSLLQQPWVSHHNSLGYDASQAPPNHSNALNWPNSRAPYSGRQAPY